MKIGDLVTHKPSCFDDPWLGGIIVESRVDSMSPALTQHHVYWPLQEGEDLRWIEEGFLEKAT
jgi:hypothetical protein